MSRKIHYLWVTLLVSLTCAGLVLAQVTTGTISGTVRDETGAVLPGVTINAVNTDTGIARTVISDDEGRYHAVNLAVGPYEIRAELTGFQSSLRSGVQLTIGREAVVDFAFLCETVGVGQTRRASRKGDCGFSHIQWRQNVFRHIVPVSFSGRTLDNGT